MVFLGILARNALIELVVTIDTSCQYERANSLIEFLMISVYFDNNFKVEAYEFIMIMMCHINIWRL